MVLRPTEPQSIGAVLDTTFQLYKASLPRMILLCVALALASLPPYVYQLLHVSDLSDASAALRMLASPGYWLSYAVSIIAAIWIIAALYLKIAATAAAEELGAATALRQALRYLPRLAVLTVLFTLALLIGTVLLLVPGLILMVSLMPSFNLAIYENKGALAALIGSHRLVWGNWWRTVAILTVGFIVAAVIYMLAFLLIALLGPIVGLSRDAVLFSTLAGMVVGGLINLLVTPLYVCMVIAIYWDLKLRKEGGDLTARIGALDPA